MNKFKKGDKVKCINPNNSNGYKGGGWISGHEFIVNYVSEDSSYCVAKGNSWGVFFEYLELVSKKCSLNNLQI